jgi:hypothetical protein
VKVLWWCLPRRTFPDRRDPTFKAYNFFVRVGVVMIIGLGVLAVVQGAGATSLRAPVGLAVLTLTGWFVLIGVVDSVRYLLVPKESPRRRHG